jgi:hypothetical protein
LVTTEIPASIVEGIVRILTRPCEVCSRDSHVLLEQGIVAGIDAARAGSSSQHHCAQECYSVTRGELPCSHLGFLLACRAIALPTSCTVAVPGHDTFDRKRIAIVGARAASDFGQLAQRFGASLARARRVAPIFEPKINGLTFAMWHAASLRTATPGFRIYVNPLARGRSHAMPSVVAALETLGMAGAAAWLSSRFPRGEHSPLYFSVDLSDGPAARCKVYLAHPAATAERLDSLIAGIGGHEPGDIRAFCREMTGTTGPWARRPPLTCLAFREGCARPYTVTFHIPIRCYAPNDEVALERISGQLTPGDAVAYGRAVRRLARGPLDRTSGIQTYASVRREDGRKRMTIYLSPEAYSAPLRRATNASHHTTTVA